jgi:osmoprotectant transport system permease protein
MNDRPFLDWSWIADHLSEIGRLTLDHIVLTGLAVGIGLAISFPLAVMSYRRRWLYTPVTWVAGLLYTIPSLALFAFLVPLTGLSKLTAEIGLVSYTLLILIRNIFVGLEGIPSDVKEAARGMGHSSHQLLWRVEMPLALPAVVAGLRIATVTTIGLVTVTAIITEGGLGDLILRGLRLVSGGSTLVVVGGGLSLILAIAADAALLAIQRALTPWSRRRTVGALG